MQLLPITLDNNLNAEFESDPACKETLQMTFDFYGRVGYVPPWTSYYAKLDGQLVGVAGFKGKPKNNKVEVSYGTFPEFEGKGIGTEICRQMVLLALKTDPAVTITARTLPEVNASGSILKKNGFKCMGTVWDEEDGNVWEWEYQR